MQPGVAAVSLQHDGVVIALGEGKDIAVVEAQLARASSEALGYEQPCEHKGFDLPDGAHAPPHVTIESLEAVLGVASTPSPSPPPPRPVAVPPQGEPPPDPPPAPPSDDSDDEDDFGT